MSTPPSAYRHPPRHRRRRRLRLGVAIAGLSLTGVLGRIPLLALPALIAAGMAVPLVLIARSPAMRNLVREIDIAHLTWFNTWRIAAAVSFFAVGAAGLLPGRFVANAAWG